MAISVPRDENRVPALLATSNADGRTVVSVYAKASTHGLIVSDATTGSGTQPTNIQRDANRVPSLWAVSSADGRTLVEIYCDPSTHALLVDSA